MYRYTDKKLSDSLPVEKDTFKPQMTSLIDILTLLLIFLIQSFSSEGTLITPSQDLQLPVSSSKTAPAPAPIIEITRTAVASNGEVIAPITSIVGKPALQIENLYQWLLDKKKILSDTANNKSVIIQCDRDIEFNVVKRVMFTCSKAGFTDFSVLAIQE
jgi:biopolymer transport protein ExbD